MPDGRDGREGRDGRDGRIVGSIPKWWGVAVGVLGATALVYVAVARDVPELVAQVKVLDTAREDNEKTHIAIKLAAETTSRDVGEIKTTLRDQGRKLDEQGQILFSLCAKTPGCNPPRR